MKKEDRFGTDISIKKALILTQILKHATRLYEKRERALLPELQFGVFF